MNRIVNNVNSFNSLDVEPFKICTDKGYIDTFGTFHTHPGEIMKTQPSAADLMSQKAHGMLICIGAPKAKEDSIRNKHLSKVEEIERNKKLEDIYILERKIRFRKRRKITNRVCGKRLSTSNNGDR